MSNGTGGTIRPPTGTFVALVGLALLAGTIAAGLVLSPSADTTAAVAGAANVDDQRQAPSGYSGTLNASGADAKLAGEAENDSAGWSVAAAGDVDGDGVEDLIVGAPRNDTAAGNDSGAAYLFFGPVERDEVDLRHADLKLTGANGGDGAGWSVSTAGDLNGDGVDDVLIGAPTNDDNGDHAGAAYVVHGGSWLANSASASESASMSLEDANATLYGGEDDRAGWSVSNTTALQGNESGVIVGASTDDEGGHDAGAAFLVAASSIEKSTVLEVGADAKLVGEGVGDHAGSSVSWAGDVDADGAEDALVGAPRNDTTGDGSGAAYVVYGPVDGTANLSDANVTMRGEGPLDRAGSSVSTAGDVDDDGVDDVIVGAPGNDSAVGNDSGAAYVVYGSNDLAGEVALSDADVTFAGAAAGDRAGHSVAAAGSGDVTCDGVDDVLIGAPDNDSTAPNAGAAYLVAGDESLAGERNLTDADAAFVGEGEGDRFGHSLGSAGDQDDDGVDDVLVGAPHNDSTAADAGAAYLFVGDCPPPREPPEATETPTDTPEPTSRGTETKTEPPTETVTERETTTERATPTETPTERTTETATESPTPTERATETATPGETRTEPPTRTDTQTEPGTPTPTVTDPATATRTGTPSGGETGPGTETETTGTATPTSTETRSPTSPSTETRSPTATSTQTDEGTVPATDATTETGAPTTVTTSPTEMPDTSDPEGPEPGEVDSDASTRIVSHDLKDYPDGRVSVGGTIENPTDEPVSRMRVTVVLYDASGAEIGNESAVVSNVPPGGAEGYAVTFEDVDYSDVERYRVVSAAVA